MNYFLVDAYAEAFVNPTFILSPKVTASSFVAYPADRIYKGKSENKYSLQRGAIYTLVNKPLNVFNYQSGYKHVLNPKLVASMFKDSERN